ncbi:21595_t:CDS:2, partial [Dentiscutata erythropus]
MCLYIAGSKTRKRSRAGERYFEEFNSHFWERPETPFDILHNTNTSTRRRHHNRTPPPIYEMPSIPSINCREFSTSQRDRSASPIRRATSERNEDTSETVTTGNNRDNGNNENNVNAMSGGSGRNADNVSGDSGCNANVVGGNLDVTYSSSSDSKMSTTSTPAHNATEETTLAEAVRNLDTENFIEFLHGKKDLQLDEADFKILCDEKIA